MFWGPGELLLRRMVGSSAFFRGEAGVHWLGVPGMRWSKEMPEVHYFARLDRPPNILVLHVGGNDLGGSLQ